MRDTAVMPWSFDGEGIRLFEAVPESMLVLRVWRPDEGGLALLAQAFEQSWPVQPNTVTTPSTDCRVAWLAPGEWLLIGSDAAAAAATAAAALGATLHHLSDLSASNFRICIEGENARPLIAKACSLDLHHRVFGPGRCARTVFAQLPALILRTGDESFELHVDDSWRDYLLTWLRQAVQDAKP